jgi:predicted ATPase
VIRQRVARQSETSRRALSVAAIAGPSFSLTTLELVLEGESGVLDALDEATAAGLLTETGPGDYAFAHALVRQAIYAGLSSARRMRMHRQIGEALEALGDRESHIEALAHHFAEAAADGQAHKAAAYALAAGRGATAGLAYEDAIAHYRRGLQALALAPQSDDRQRCELLLALGEALWRTEDLADAREACLQAGVLAERLGLTAVQARAALGVAGPVRLEVPTAATEPVVAVMEKALAALPEEESALRARLMARLAAVVAFSRPEQRRPALAREALDIARRAGDKAALAEVLDASTWATTGPDNLDERMDMLRELARLATELGDISLRASAHEAKPAG